VGYNVQDQNDDAKVKANAGTYGVTGAPQTDFIISESGYPNDHRHIVIDEYGNTVYDQIDPNR
jgi:hypothetical protein